MRRISILSALFFTTALLNACGSADDNRATETRMDDIDSLEGTISDDAINTDDSTEEGLIDPSAPPEATAQPDKKKPEKEAETPDKSAADKPAAAAAAKTTQPDGKAQ